MSTCRWTGLVALIGAGGTIASRGDGPLELLNDAMDGTRLSARDLMDCYSEVGLVADVVRARAHTNSEPTLEAD